MDITIGSSLGVMIATPALLLLFYCPKRRLSEAGLSSFNGVISSQPTESQKPTALKDWENFTLATGFDQYLQRLTLYNELK